MTTPFLAGSQTDLRSSLNEAHFGEDDIFVSSDPMDNDGNDGLGKDDNDDRFEEDSSNDELEYDNSDEELGEAEVNEENEENEEDEEDEVIIEGNEGNEDETPVTRKELVVPFERLVRRSQRPGSKSGYVFNVLAYSSISMLSAINRARK